MKILDLQKTPWLAAPETAAVITALEAAGGPDCVRFVGGCVRNTLVGQTVDDIDLATTLKPEATMSALQAAGLKVVPTGLAHGTVTAVANRKPYEITTLRRDVSTDGRRATVAFTDDWAADAARRDFRLNALYADPQGRIFDPTDAGVEDALAGRVIFVGDPERRIREDFLRILRFFRFFAWYGRGAPDPEGLAACARLAEGVEQLSAERVSKELMKLLAAPDPREAIGAMDRAGVLGRIIPDGPGIGLFKSMAVISDDPVLRLSALMSDQPRIVSARATALRLPNPVRDRLAAAAGDPIDLAMSERQARSLLYGLGLKAFRDRVLRAQAASPDQGAQADQMLRLAETWTIPRLPVGGRDVTRLGGGEGPETGRLLKAFETGWIADDFPDHGHEARLKRLIDESVRAPRG